MGAQAQQLSGHRATAFEYDAISGLLTAEVLEPDAGRADSCLRTVYTHDTYGNRTGMTLSGCTGASAQAQFTSRTTTTAYASYTVTVSGSSIAVPAGAFATQVTNALSQSEMRQYDPRFGGVISQTGPNALTTTAEYDLLGRKVLEVAADGNRVATRHCLLPAKVTDTSSNSAGCVASPPGAPAAAVSYVESQPQNAAGTANGPYARKYSDALGRVVREETQGFDGAGQPGNARILVKDTEYNAWGAAARVSQPYFLDTGSSVTAGGAAGWTVTLYDALDRPVTIYTRDDEGAASYQGATVSEASRTYNGLVVTETTVRTSRDGQGQQQASTTLSTTRVKDPLGQLVQVVDVTGATLSQKFDAFGSVVESRDAQDNRIVTTFDQRGRKTQLADPNAGTWNYRYNALGELTGQQSPLQVAGTPSITAGHWTTLAYDLLGRLVSRTEPEYTTTWSYDKYANNAACTKGIGKLCEVVTSHGVSKKTVYDSYGRPSSTTQAVTSGPSFTSSQTYDANGRLATATYPTGVSVTHTYTALGYPSQISRGATMLWQLTKTNAWGKPEQFVLGDAAQTTQHGFDAQTGRATAIQAGSAASPAALLSHAYGWDTVGNLTDRVEVYDPGSNHSLSENFGYDGLNRLTSYQTSSPGIASLSRTVSLAYSPIGNILYKSDVGIYSYPASGAASVRPGAVASIAAGSGGTLGYSYDVAGNLTGGSGGKYSQVSYTSFNLPDGQNGVLGANANRYTWQYGPDHERVKEVRVAGGTTRTTWYHHPDNQNGLGFEQEHVGATITNRHYVSAAGQAFVMLTSVGTHTNIAAQTLTETQWWHRDHLGSIATITNAAYAVTQRFSYDPFGKRRDINGSYDANGVLVYDHPTATDRGFTGHEHLDDVGIVNMNGRMYDPHIGRFMQADPFIQAPDLLQNYNRYSYVLNNPLNATDPSGQFFAPIFAAIASSAGYVAAGIVAARAVGLIDTKTARGLLGAVALMTIAGNPQWFGVVGTESMRAEFLAGVIGGAASGAIACGADCAAMGGFSGALFSTVAVTAKGLAQNHIGRITMHGVAGCIASEAGGEKCGHGAMTAALSKAITSNLESTGDIRIDTVRSAMIAGVISEVGGGKFANGAVMGAFQYLFNQALTGRNSPETKVLDAVRRGDYDEAKFLLENATAGEVSPAVGRAIQAGLELKNLGYSANSIQHIMNSKHMLGPLVRQLGSNEAAALRIHEAAQTLVAVGKNYQTGTWVALRVEQTVVHVKGAIVNGTFRVSTATMKPF
ncbi:MAG: RHS repeat-associated core domain-containing protein [Burkholderiales bacterium]|nr:RHS repeat-associated core domain-containing protein [Burkholderiales bacterium]